MELTQALRLGRGLMDEHGLGDWTLELDRAKRRAGSCQTGTRRLTISRHLTLLHDEETVRDTLLHEIAHARVGPQHGHDAVWRREARRIGCSGERTLGEDLPSVEAPWQGVCPAGHTVQRHRRPQRVASCPKCSRQFSPEHLYTWTFQGRSVAMPPTYAAQLASLRRPSAGAGQLDGRAPAPIGVGQRVRVLDGGRYSGVEGVVVKRGRTRLHVRTRRGLLTVPFALAQPVDLAG